MNMAELPAANIEARPPTNVGEDVWGLEARIARVDTSVNHVQKEVAALRLESREVRDRLARLEYRVASLPSKGFALAALAVGLLIAALLVTFQPEVRTFIRAGIEALDQTLERGGPEGVRQPPRAP